MVYRGSYIRPTSQPGQQVIPQQMRRNAVVRIPSTTSPQKPTVQTTSRLCLSENVRIQAIGVLIVSTKYAKKLNLVLDACRKQSSIARIFVATDALDSETLDVLRNYPEAQSVLVDFKHRGAIFDKGCALKHLQEIAHKDTKLDAILVLDSDIVLPDVFDSVIESTKFQKGHLYGPRSRFLVYSKSELNENECSRREFPKLSSIIGYFQLYTRPFLNAYDHSKNASACDVDFANRWPRTKQHRLGLDVIHLGRINTHWNGIQREDFVWT